MRERPAGNDAVLLDFSGDDDAGTAAAAAAGALRAAAAGGLIELTDVIPAADTVLVQAPAGRGLDVLSVRRVIRSAATDLADPAVVAGEVSIPVFYDGEDLEDVGRIGGLSADDVVAAHSGLRWRVQFLGFAPGFGYLVPDAENDPELVAVFADLGRREQSRPAVPTGSVAVAAGYSAVYPRVSPGGWFLLGRTATTMWDPAVEPPALLQAGTVVRFTCVR